MVEMDVRYDDDGYPSKVTVDEYDHPEKYTFKIVDGPDAVLWDHFAKNDPREEGRYVDREYMAEVIESVERLEFIGGVYLPGMEGYEHHE